MKKIWTTRDGKEIPYKNIENDHLLNIIKFVKRRAKEMDGEVIDGGGCCWDTDDIWYVIGSEQDWLDKYDYKGLLAETRRRKLTSV